MFHKVTLVGRLGGPPEMRYTPEGRAVTNFSVAANRKWSGGEETIWFRVTTWGNTAEACNQWLQKGQLVLIEGRLTPDRQTGGPRVWTSQDGQPRANFEVRALEVKFLGGGGRPAAEEGPGDDYPVEDEIPF